MESRLGSLKKRISKTKLRDGKTLGGKGRFIDARIDSLQVCYGKAIRENVNSLQSMKNAVNAIWHHTRSTDESPHHHLCPEREMCHSVVFKKILQMAQNSTTMTIHCLK